MNKQEELKATMEAQAAEARLLEMVRRAVFESEARIIRLMKAYADDCKYTTQPIKPDPDKPVPVENMADKCANLAKDLADQQARFRDQNNRIYDELEETRKKLYAQGRWETGFRNIVTILVGARTEFEIEDIVERVRKLHEDAQVNTTEPDIKFHWNKGTLVIIREGKFIQNICTREEAGKIVQFLLNTRCEIRL